MATFTPEGGVFFSSAEKKIVYILALLACFTNLIKIETVEFYYLLRGLQFIYSEMIHVFLIKCYSWVL